MKSLTSGSQASRKINSKLLVDSYASETGFRVAQEEKLTAGWFFESEEPLDRAKWEVGAGVFVKEDEGRRLGVEFKGRDRVQRTLELVAGSSDFRTNTRLWGNKFWDRETISRMNRIFVRTTRFVVNGVDFRWNRWNKRKNARLDSCKNVGSVTYPP